MPEPALPERRRAVADLLAAWTGGLAPLVPRSLPLAAARGGVLAEPVTLAAPLPAAAVALVDGRAVIADETFGASPYAPAVLGRSRAVAAGEPVPPPFDAVAAVDEADAVSAGVALAPGANLRRIGADAAAGTVVLPVGTRLGARALAVAEAAGIVSIAVRRGRAVIALAAPTSDGEVATLCADLLAAHAVAATIVPLESLAAAVAEPGLVLALGGAAIGAGDPAWRAVATAPGWRPLGRPALRPGDGAVAGWLGASPALVLPARPDDALALALALVLPLADALTGAATCDRADRRPLARKLVSTVGLAELALVAATTDGDGWEPLGVGTLGAAALAGATHWALVPPESEGCAAGLPFAAHPWPEAP